MRSKFSTYFLTVMSVVFLVYLVNAYITKRDASQKDISEKESIERCTQNDFEVSDVQLQNAARDTVGTLAITITNKGDYDCKDMRGIILFLSHENTEPDKSDFIISGKIGSKETKTFKGISLKQRTSEEVQDVSITIEGATVYSEKGE